ncbi:MAG: AmmeMemoRadiSam system radical SAM enzyme [Microgenomates group bacterium]
MKKGFVGLGIIVLGIIGSLFILAKTQSQRTTQNLHEASFYQQLGDDKVQCQLCPNRCVVSPGQRGVCKVRENIGGKLYSLVYGKPVTTAIDPIEKKPFYHFLPGAKAYSLATAGCNLACKYCQNWDIAQRFPEDVQSTPMAPQQVVEEALKSGAQVIAFTYNEPIVWYEYMRDIAKLAKEKGLRTVMVSSGYINPQPLKELLPYMDAIKIDFKAFNNEVYGNLIGGKLEPVLETLKIIHNSKTWLEIVHLVVPGYTDNLEEIGQMCLWLKENVGEDVPIHFSRFWPKYKLTNLPPTPEETIKKARLACLKAGMKYVYTGNIEDEEGSATYCPTNHQPVIKRFGYFVKENLIDSSGKAPNCRETIPGVWK